MEILRETLQTSRRAAAGRGIWATFTVGLLTLTACGGESVVETPVTEEELAGFIEDNDQAFPEEAVVAVVDGEEVITASTDGADMDTVFEIASMSKPLTGMLLADAVDRGEVDLQDELGQLLPELAETEVGGVTLLELATHTSGLPLVPTAEDYDEESDGWRAQGRNPYPITADGLIDLATQQSLGSPGSYEYSNMGISLLGHALAAQAGMSYEDLLAERLTEPVGMEETFASDHRGHDSDELLIEGYSNGGEVESFASEAFSPSSSLRSSTEDWVQLMQAIHRGEAPGMTALEPTDVEPRMGLGWAADGDYVWHNGISNGYASIVFIDPEEDLGVVILTNYAYQNTELGRQLIQSLD